MGSKGVPYGKRKMFAGPCVRRGLTEFEKRNSDYKTKQHDDLQNDGFFALPSQPWVMIRSPKPQEQARKKRGD